MPKMSKIKSAILIFTLLVVACTKVPDGVISQGKMEDILYDSYIGEGVVENELTPTYSTDAQLVYTNSILKKYGVSRAEYDSSLNWYMANLQVYNKVYERVIARLKKEEAKVQMESGYMGSDAKIAEGDSVNLWNKSKSIHFTELPLLGNLFTEIKNDESFKLGDSITFEANVRLLSTTKRQAPRMVLTFVYQNDSAITYTKELLQSERYLLRTKLDTTQRINLIKAGFYQNQNGVVVVDQIRLMRVHPKGKK